MEFYDDTTREQWEWLFDVTLHVRGDAKKIIEVMNENVRGARSERLWRELGICSAGFLFEDMKMRDQRFLGVVQEESFFTDYLWNLKDQGEKFSKLVHYLFLRIRRIQKQRRTAIATKVLAEKGIKDPDDVPFNKINEIEFELAEKFEADEEYLRYLSTDSGCEKNFPACLSKHGMHYCSLGETLLTTAVWRLLSFLVDQGRGDVPIEKVSLRLDDQRRNAPSCSWRQESMFDDTLDGEINGIDLNRRIKREKPLREIDKLVAKRSDEEARAAIAKLWSSCFTSDDCWIDEWRYLNFIEESQEGAICFRKAAVLFAEAIGVKGACQNFEVEDDASMNGLLLNSVPILLQDLGVDIKNISVVQALYELESRSRFPILPFFVWNFLDDGIKTYLAVSTWVTQKYALKVSGGRSCHNLGFALCGIVPLSQVDETVPEKIRSVKRFVSAARPLLIQNLLNRLAQPLVESNLYAILRASEVAKKVEREMAQAATNERHE